MVSDNSLILRSMTGSQDGLTRTEKDQLLEFFMVVQTGGALTGRQRATLHGIALKAGHIESTTSPGLAP